MTIRIELETRTVHAIEVNLPDGVPLTVEAVRDLLLAPGELGVAPKDCIEDDPPPHQVAERWLRAVEVDEPNPAYQGDEVLFGDPPPKTITKRVEL